MKKLFYALLLTPVLGGCAIAPVVDDIISQGQVYGAKGAATLVVNECGLSGTLRRSNADAVKQKLESLGSPAKFLLDCDGDGVADFQ